MRSSVSGTPLTIPRGILTSDMFIRIAAFICLLGFWELAVRLWINPLFLPAPSAIFWGFIETGESGELFRQLGETLSVLVLGYLLAVFIGIPVGILMGRYRPLAVIFEPYVNALYATPTVALVPVVIIWLGLGYEAKVFLTWLVALFPIVINAYIGVINIPGSMIDTAKAFGANERQIFFKVILHAAIPFFVAGLRLGLGRGLVGVVVAEMFTALTGLGYMVTYYGNIFKTALLFVPIITLGLLSVFLTELLKWLEKKIAPWKVS